VRLIERSRVMPKHNHESLTAKMTIDYNQMDK
jgi:hypothetical protein